MDYYLWMCNSNTKIMVLSVTNSSFLKESCLKWRYLYNRGESWHNSNAYFASIFLTGMWRNSFSPACTPVPYQERHPVWAPSASFYRSTYRQPSYWSALDRKWPTSCPMQPPTTALSPHCSRSSTWRWLPLVWPVMGSLTPHWRR